MIEFVVTFLLEIVGELLFNALLEGVSRGFAAVLSNRVTRLVVAGLVCAVGGYAGGYWWGSRLSGERETHPKTFYVAIVLACVFALAAAVRNRREAVGHLGGQVAAGPGSAALPGGRRTPWSAAYWSPARLTSFAIVNAAVAIGIATSFTAYQPG